MADEIRFRRQIEDMGFSILYHVLTLDKKLSDQAFRLYSLLLKYARQKGHAYPGVERLAEDLGKSESSISRALAELKERGLISRQRRFGTSSITWIEDPNEVYQDVLEQMGESIKNDMTDDEDYDPVKNDRTEDHDPVKNDRTESGESVKNDGTEDHDPVKNDMSNLSKMTGKEKEEKKKERGEEEEKEEPISSLKNEEKEASIWQAALGELRLQITKPAFDTWLKNTRLVSCQDDIFVIGAQDEFARSWLEDRLLAIVRRTLTGIVGHVVEVRFVTDT